MRDFDWWLKWTSTVLLILGAVTTSLQWTLVNVALSFLGNLGWMIAGFKMKEPSLWSVSAVLMIIYVVGVVIAW